MPSHRDRTKVSGDVHPPEIEDGAEDRSADSPLGRDLEDEGRAGKGENQAGFLKEKDAPGEGGSERR